MVTFDCEAGGNPRTMPLVMSQDGPLILTVHRTGNPNIVFLLPGSLKGKPQIKGDMSMLKSPFAR